MKKILMVVLLLAGCTDAGNVQRVLAGAGYSDIKITGYSWFSCGEGDTYSTGFTAKGPTGIMVEGAVCSGVIFKNSTITLD